MIKFFKLVPQTNINFIGARKYAFILSGALMLAALGAVIFKGLNYGIDFTGGTMVQVQFEAAAGIDNVRSALSGGGVGADIQSFVGKDAYSIKVKGSQTDVNEVAKQIEASLQTVGVPFSVEQVDFVGPSVGSHLAKKAFLAFALAMAAMVIYVGFRFSNIIWGAMTVAAMFHDVFFVVGIFALLQIEVDLVIVAALLTVAGFSVNDTIVIFDRVRENIAKNPKAGLKTLLNLSVNETLSRTVITSLTVVSAALILFLVGGGVLRNFSFAMLIGLVCGVYTSACLAPGLVYWWSGNEIPQGPQAASGPEYQEPKKKSKKRIK